MATADFPLTTSATPKKPGFPDGHYLTDGTGAIKAQAWYEYFPGTVNLKKKTDWLTGAATDPDNPVTNYTYDSYGNIQTITDPNQNPPTTFIYDATKTYQASVTNTNNQINFTTSKTYDYRYGKPKTETDLNNNTTTYEYDPFGRPIMVISPNDTLSYPTQIFSYDDFGQGVGTQRIKTFSTEESGTSNNIWQETYFDGLGRTVATRSEGPDDKVIVTGTIYNKMGRVTDSSLPYFEGQETSSQWFSYEYDPLGRVTKVTNPADKSTTKSYTLWTTAITDANGHKKEEDRDAHGRLVTVREYNSDFTLYATTNYQYDARDNLIQVTDAQNNITTIHYDNLGRKDWMDDPDMGHWLYSYDKNGNLRSQTDAKGQKIEFKYDVLNRLTNKLYPITPNVVPDVFYAYDETDSNNPGYYNIGRLTTACNVPSRTEACDNSVKTKLYYDKLGRTTRTIKMVNGANYQTDTAYDAMGRTKSITYPTLNQALDPAETVNYTYNTGGSLWQVGGYAIYTGYNAAGQVGTVTYPNGAVSRYTYEPETLRLATMETRTGSAPGSSVDTVAYNWVTANTPTGVVADDWYATFSLPFTFNFFGTNYTQAHISSNGFVSFVDSGNLWDYTPDPIPSVNQPNALAAGLWRDLNPGAGGCANSACITYGSTANQFAVSYNNVKNYGNASRQTFQILLNSDGSIVYQYATVTNDYTTSVGVENQTGATGTPYANPSNGLAMKFTPGAVGTLLQSRRYSYDNVGNITSITDNLDGSRTQTFTYDELNRLKQAKAQAPTYGTIDYSYDEIGNMRSNSRVGLYDYPTNHIRPHAVSTAGAISYQYDANGNRYSKTSTNGTTITAYDYDNRPVSVGATTMVYDYAGQRVKKNSTVYIGNIYECTGTTCTKYIFAGGQRIARKVGTTLHYYHADHLGSASMVTNSSGTQVEGIHYYPYGETWLHTGSANVKHKYTGQEEDAEIGLYYYGARYYDPIIGRFISADTIVPTPSDPQSLNRYSYVYNNPIIYTDPNGQNPFVIGLIIGAIIAGIQSDWDFESVVVGGIIGGLSGGVFAEASAATQTALQGVVKAGTANIISNIAGGAIAGQFAAGYSTAYFGGNVGDAMLKGAGLGAASGAAFGAIGYPNSFGKVLAYTAVGGGLSELAGGDFGDGAMISGGLALMTYGYYSFTNGRLPKGELSDGTAMVKSDKPAIAMQQIVDNPNVSHMGVTAIRQSDLYTGVHEGNKYLRWITSHIPTFNDISVLHDFGAYKVFDSFWNPVTNWGSMIPAGALTVGAVMGYHMPLTWSVGAGVNEGLNE